MPTASQTSKLLANVHFAAHSMPHTFIQQPVHGLPVASSSTLFLADGLLLRGGGLPLRRGRRPQRSEEGAVRGLLMPSPPVLFSMIIESTLRAQ